MTVSPREEDVDWSEVAAPSGALEDAHRVFRRWLGDDYDVQALDAVLAAGGEVTGVIVAAMHPSYCHPGCACSHSDR